MPVCMDSGFPSTENTQQTTTGGSSALPSFVICTCTHTCTCTCSWYPCTCACSCMFSICEISGRWGRTLSRSASDTNSVKGGVNSMHYMATPAGGTVKKFSRELSHVWPSVYLNAENFDNLRLLKVHRSYQRRPCILACQKVGPRGQPIFRGHALLWPSVEKPLYM